jgi:hypothetical protein
MKRILFFTIALCSCLTATAQDTAKKSMSSTRQKGRSAVGIISTKYAVCGTVILSIDAEKKDTEVFIPIGDTAISRYTEGTKVSFHYMPLKIRNPKGCVKGGPVRILDMAKVVPHHKRKKKKATPTAGQSK